MIILVLIFAMHFGSSDFEQRYEFAEPNMTSCQAMRAFAVDESKKSQSPELLASYCITIASAQSPDAKP